MLKAVKTRKIETMKKTQEIDKNEGTAKRRNSLIVSKFTLVELMIVIAIIAVLAAMLLPALNKALDTAKRIKCASNMKQLGTAFMFYANTYDNWIPGRYSSERFNLDGGSGVWPWPRLLAVTKVFEYNLASAEKGSTILRCPSTTQRGNALTNYGYNNSLRIQALNANMRARGCWSFSDDFIKLDTIKRSSTVSLLGECVETTYQIDPSNLADAPYPIRVEFRHNNGMNMLFADGHVELMSSKEVRCWTSTAIRVAKPWF